jgi:hypothetical protein
MAKRTTRVHYNLQRCPVSKTPKSGETCWVKRNARRVTGYSKDLTLHNATFVVQPGGLKRVRAKKQRAVIAYVKGDVDSCPVKGRWQRVRFNPFRDKAFKVNGKAVKSARCVRFRGREAEALL